jgi:acyl dehydratase
MPFDPQKLLARRFGEVSHVITRRDTILYALGVGYGSDPLDRAELKFVYERDLVAAPTMAAVLSNAGPWLHDPALGVDWVKVVHGEQAVTIHRPLPVAGTVIGRTRVTGIHDKGPGKGALVVTAREVVHQGTGELLATITSSAFCRGDGGCGGSTGPAPTPVKLPERAPDLAIELATLPQAALIYRLSGDLNPLHVDPDVATAAGYPRPILHGLATYGIAGRALLRGLCDYDPARLTGISGRFTAPVYPGESLRTEIWRDEAGAFFRVRVPSRDVIALDHGRAEIAR